MLCDLELLGQGKDRTVYKLGNYVIKYAPDDTIQNKNEFILWGNRHKYNFLKTLLNPCHYISDDYRFLVADYCSPITKDKEKTLYQAYHSARLLFDVRKENHWGINVNSNSVKLVDYGHSGNIEKLFRKR